MSIGVIIILIVAVGLVLGPVMMMRPSPAQKNRESMRLVARAEGVHYSIRNLPQQADEQEKPAPIAVYFLPPAEANPSLDNWMLLRTRYQHDIHFLGWWAWRDGNRPLGVEETVLREHLGGLPGSVKAVSGGAEGLSVYWDETGGEPVLKQVLKLLKALQAAAIR